MTGGSVPKSKTEGGVRITMMSGGGISISELAEWAPLRLTAEERSLLTVLEQTLHVSEYTDHVDVTMGSRMGGVKTRRILDGILEACHIATGLAVASGHEGQLLADSRPSRGDSGDETMHSSTNNNAAAMASGSWAEQDPANNSSFFQSMFEIGRRNKVLNPSSMRSTYGKLMYLLQDAQNPTVCKSIGFSLHKDLLLVGRYLRDRNCADLLDDPRLECAVQFIPDRDQETGDRQERSHVEAMVVGKRQVTDTLVDAYSAKGKLSADEIRRVIESLADAVAYIESNLQPVQAMLRYLETNFNPDQHEKGFSLALRSSSRGFSSSGYSRYGLSAYNSGSEGPTLSHSHKEQYIFVWQSLRLWCKVMRNMHRLWVCADDDLLSTTSTYHLYNTGQGLNRVQSCPRVHRVMSNLLQQTQQEAGAPWVGLSVIHLGDRDVPNALIFIDKYTQIPRFLSPIVLFLRSIPELCQDPRIDQYIREQFGSAELLKMNVLTDYFKHGFDGSGDDGGSCIDGRLTSSWNWTSRLVKKKYYHPFMLSGFQGFDGDFR